MSLECIELDYEKSCFTYNEKLRNVPIGIIDDVEICFLHYDNIENALSKWNKRRQRINYNNILVKFSDQNGFQLEDYDRFNEINYPKLFITANKNLKNEDVIYVKEFEELGYAKDDIKPSFKYINIKKILNKLEN